MIDAQKQKEDFPLNVRLPMADDESIIYKAWLEGFKDSIWLRSYREMTVEDSDGNRIKVAQPIKKNETNKIGIPSDVYYDEQRAKIEKLLQRSTTLVACAVDDPTQVYGFIVGENHGAFVVVHYAYVKGTFRRFGICGRLLKELGFTRKKQLFYSHPTWATSEIGENRFGAKFNPWLSE